MTPAEKVAKAKSYIMLKEPFFGYLLVQTPIEMREDIPTFATDMHKIYYNPEFAETKTPSEVVFILLHEILHIVGKHGWRRYGRIPLVWNMATDYFINAFLVEAGHKMVEGGLFENAYQRKSSEEIYDLLVEDMPEPPPSGGGQGAPGDGSDGDGSDGDQSDGPGNFGDADDLLPPASAPGSQEQQQHSANLDSRVAAAATMARMAGKLSAPLKRMVEELLTPKVPWHEVLAEYMTELIEGDEDWTARDRRFCDVFLPETTADPAMGELVIIGDSSGSITDADFQLICSEAAACADMLNPEALRMVWATSRVVSDVVFERGEELKFESPESGGTDMRVPLTHVEQYEPAAVVLITDGYTPWPDVPPPYPLIVCCTTDTDVPVGKVIRV